MVLTTTWFGEVLSKVGYGVLARRIMKPIMDNNLIEIYPQAIENYIPDEKKIRDPYWLAKLAIKPPSKVDLNLTFGIPPVFQRLEGTSIGWFIWETSTVPREWQKAMFSMDAIITTSQAVSNAVLATGYKGPVGTVLPFLDTKLWNPIGYETNVAGIPKDHIVFLHDGFWVPRNNLGDTLLGFATAFDGISNVHLVIKVTSIDDSLGFRTMVENTVKELLNSMHGISRPKVHIITDIQTDEQQARLYRSIDAYISVSNGDGFDSKIPEALASGKLVVATNFLNNKEYLTEENSIPVSYTLSPVGGMNSPLYAPYQEWARVDMRAYVQKLRFAYKMLSNGSAQPIKQKARESILHLGDLDRIPTQLQDIYEQANKSRKIPKIHVPGLV